MPEPQTTQQPQPPVAAPSQPGVPPQPQQQMVPLPSAPVPGQPQQPQQPQPPEQQKVDALLQLYHETRGVRQQLRQMKTITAEGVHRQLEGSAFSVLEDVIFQFLQYRQWTIECFGDVDARVSTLEDQADEDNALTAEEVAVLVQFAGGAMGVIQKCIEQPGQSADGKKMLLELMALGEQQLQIATDAGPADDEDEQLGEQGTAADVASNGG